MLSLKKIFWNVTPIILVLLALVSGVLIYRWGVSQDETQNIPQPQNVELSPSPEPVKDLKKENLRIKVLNGVGVMGAAAEAKSFLEELGYKDVAVGDADNYNFTKTLVEVKESKKDYSDVLVKDLLSRYEASPSSTFLNEANEFDAIVTIGAE